MTRARLVKTSFTAGELDPLLLGRLDLKAHEDGASRLRNVIVHPTGGVTRRPGTAYLATVPNGLRMVPFEGPDGGEILVFGPFRIDVVKAGTIIASITAEVPWSAAHVPGLSWVRLDDRLLSDIGIERGCIAEAVDATIERRAPAWAVIDLAHSLVEPLVRPIVKWRRDAVTLGELGQLDDHLLADIGVSRGDLTFQPALVLERAQAPANSNVTPIRAA